MLFIVVFDCYFMVNKVEYNREERHVNPAGGNGNGD